MADRMPRSLVSMNCMQDRRLRWALCVPTYQPDQLRARSRTFVDHEARPVVHFVKRHVSWLWPLVRARRWPDPVDPPATASVRCHEECNARISAAEGRMVAEAR